MTSTAVAHTAEDIARQILKDNGVQGEPHPALLADTVREVEYHGATMPVSFEPAEEAPAEWSVVKQETQVPCEHIACDLMHRRFYNESMDRQLIEVYNMHGEHIANRWEDRYHAKTVVQWSLVNPEGWAVESFDTQAEALTQLDRQLGRN